MTRRDDVVFYRIRVDLDHARPPIWRRPDLSLDVEEGEAIGIAAADVRLDETLQDPGDVLRYVYDYGDAWELTLRLEKVLPAVDDAPSAVAIEGRRAAPPEDCGGIVDAASLAEVLDKRLVNLSNRLRYTDVGEDLIARLLDLGNLPTEPSPSDLDDSLRAYRWFLDRANGDGIELTSAGYLKPADVEAASQVVPAMGQWYGKNNRVGCGICLQASCWQPKTEPSLKQR